MIHQLRMRAEMYDSWSTRAKSALTATPGEKLCKSWRDVLGVFSQFHANFIQIVLITTNCFLPHRKTKMQKPPK